jgi:hypothetical protein
MPPRHLVRLVVSLAAAAVGQFPDLHAQAPAAAGLRIVVIAGEDAVNIIQQKTAVAPVVEVRDRNDLPIAGVPVTFAITGQNAAFAGGLQQLTILTNAAGRAVVSGLTPLASGPVQIGVTATYQGQTAAVALTQTNVLTATQAATAATGGAAQGGGGGLSQAAVAGIAAGAAAGAVAAAKVAGGNGAPAVTGVTATPAVALLGAGPIAFTAQANDPDSDSLRFSWDFGDGGTSTESSPTHTYNAAGVFNVRVSVSDGEASVTGETTVTVKTLTGTWQRADNSIVLRLTLTQSGLSVTGTSSIAPPPGGSTLVFPADCAISGQITATSPRVLLTQEPCLFTTTGQTEPLFFRLDPGPDADTLSGIISGQISGVSPNRMWVRQ